MAIGHVILNRIWFLNNLAPGADTHGFGPRGGQIRDVLGALNQFAPYKSDGTLKAGFQNQFNDAMNSDLYYSAACTKLLAAYDIVFAINYGNAPDPFAAQGGSWYFQRNAFQPGGICRDCAGAMGPIGGTFFYTYWTWAGDYVDKRYVENAGKMIAVKVITLTETVIVFIPQLSDSAIMYVRIGRRLEDPISADWMMVRGEPAVMRGSSSGDCYVIHSSDKVDFAREKPNSTQGQREWHIDLENPGKQYRVVDRQIVLLPLGALPYGPMSEDKKLLLEGIVQEVEKQADIMFDKGETVTIAVPDFNLGDPRIWVLVERIKEKSGDIGGFVIDIQLNSNPKDHPAKFTSFVIHDTKELGFASQADVIKKIRLHSIKTINHKIE